MSRSAVFLDRDDTLIANGELDWSFARPPLRPGDLCDPEQVRLLPGALDACRRLRRADLTLVVITNQALVGLGGGTLPDVHATHDRMSALLVDHDGAPLIEACYFATHHPDAPHPAFASDHPWRKPAGGMVTAAARELALDLSTSWMIGDKARDVEAGADAGLDRRRCLLIGEGAPHADLTAAAAHVLAAVSSST